MEFVSFFIVLDSFLTGFILSRSISDSGIYELPQPVSKSALHFTLFTFRIATGYVTLVSVVTNIGSDLLSANLSDVDVWCLFSHFKQVSELRHSAALCLASVQLKQSFLSLNIFLRSVTVFAVLQSEDIWSGFLQYTRSHVRSLFSLVTFAIAITFSGFRLSLSGIGFLTVYFSNVSTNC